MNQRGQATIFIVIGILIVLTVLGWYIFRNFDIRELTPKDIEVPQEAEGVKLYVEGCIGDLLETALQKLGARGGYIQLPGDPINVGQFTKTLTF